MLLLVAPVTLRLVGIEGAVVSVVVVVPPELNVCSAARSAGCEVIAIDRRFSSPPGAESLAMTSMVTSPYRRTEAESSPATGGWAGTSRSSRG